jgi:hypothetical protein
MTQRMHYLIFAVLLAVLGGCATSDAPRRKSQAEYMELVEMENRFKPEVLRQDPNQGATYSSELPRHAGQVYFALNEELGEGASPALRHAALERLMRKYGITASFTDFSLRLPTHPARGSWSCYALPLSRVQTLRAPRTKYFEYEVQLDR